MASRKGLPWQVYGGGAGGPAISCDRSTVLIYKILLPTEWTEFETTGRFNGSPFDRSSGFVHSSFREQAGGTAMRLFA